MTTKELVLKEIEKIPEPFLTEIWDFMRFLEAKILKQSMATAIASESSLKKDWLRPEEDEAWKDL
ncbi:DUF2281 domain-containing protein [candidate division WOR-3 bacterium]|nr:DUF2281 domain-containing protein [candidate division WOR-3 bacterium]